jgi:carboxypeptidase Taq
MNAGTKGLARFEHEIGRLNDILCAINILNWDARTKMPAAGATTRGQQIATLSGLAREMATGEAMRDAIEAGLDEAEAGGTDEQRRALLQTKGTIETLRRIPEALITQAAALRTRAHESWIRARANNDFASFAPLLDETVRLQRAIAQAIGFERHPYDALIGQYEPGMTLAALEPLYARLKDALLPLIDTVFGRSEQPRLDILERSFPIETQKAYAQDIAAKMGFDFTRGRLDDTVHPFEISFTREDVRITGRFRENWLPGGLFAIWHEAGHGMYEQGVLAKFTRSAFTTDIINLYAVGGASFGMHESQSRLWENRVGRSQRFWALHFPSLQDAFPEQLADVDAMEFWRAVNAVRPSFIRVEADELTYDLHIILRTEIEAALIAGEVEAGELPSLWNQKIRDFLGLIVPNDSQGLLQDVHWSSGMIGSFPTYTLGNVMGAQLFEAASRLPTIAKGLEGGNYAPLRLWLCEQVHRHGRSRTPDEILREATGSSLDPTAYIDALAEKVRLLA